MAKKSTAERWNCVYLSTWRWFEILLLREWLILEKPCPNRKLISMWSCRRCKHMLIENQSNNSMPRHTLSGICDDRTTSYFFVAAEFIGILDVRTVRFVLDQSILIDSILGLTFAQCVDFRSVVLLVLKYGDDAFFQIDRCGIVVFIEIGRGDDALVPDEHRWIACESAQRQTIDHTVCMSSIDEASIA